ncbi:MAG TPA: hypothetical protein VLB85_03700 [Acidimicrobiia bacterium]|nr:hypothetical protein [Acidimicrobiia bacterium]
MSEVIGADNATTLMSYLPYEPPATVRDLEATESALRREIAASETVLRTEIAASAESLRAELRTEMRVLDGRMDGFNERMGRFEARLDGFGDLLVTQGRTYAISTVTAVVGSVGLAAGLASIL